ncbi:1227_t:CDS:10 [Funneliformis geosporum]|uniref:1227_t:CDS:1 n=1 Tax=Funneliformis geosporum TaxID=1117311 RepID=A0A9W4WSS4_9GLOM|nr:1227_t:CDS:10 [Funneliformis geosporum]
MLSFIVVIKWEFSHAEAHIVNDPVISEQIGSQYLDGLTRLTHVSGYTGDYIRFEEIIQKNRLKSAFFCAMSIDFSWLLERLPKDAKIVVAKHWKPENGESQGIFCIPNTNILLIHPPMSNMGHGCFHAKLMVLVYDDLHIFAKELKYFLLAMGLKSHIIDKLPQYDFSRAKAIIIPSIPGVHQGIENIKKYGHVRLSQAIKNVCGRHEYVELECQSLSLGPITSEYLNEFYRSAKGLDPIITPLSSSIPLPPITLVYPTNKTVLRSKYILAGVGPLCLYRNRYEQETFPKEILRNCESNRNGILMRTKFILARFIQPSHQQRQQIKIKKRNRYDYGSDESTINSYVTAPEYPDNEIFSTHESIMGSLLGSSQETITDDIQMDDNIVGWYYCGSHNFTESAWGKLITTRDIKEPQLKIYNWELGIFLPIPKLNSDYDKENNIKEQGDWFGDHGVPVSYKRPPKHYEENDIPWGYPI